MQVIRTNKSWRADLWEHKSVIGLFLALNIADSLLTYTALSLGAEERWIVYRLSGSMTVTTIAKYAGVVIIVLVLQKIGRLRWLIWFAIAMIPVVLWWIGQLLFHLMGG